MLDAELVVDSRPNECCKSPLMPRVGISSCKSDCSVNLTSVLDDCPPRRFVSRVVARWACRRQIDSKRCEKKKAAKNQKQARNAQFDVIAKRRQSRLLFSGKNIERSCCQVKRSGDLNV